MHGTAFFAKPGGQCQDLDFTWIGGVAPTPLACPVLWFHKLGFAKTGSIFSPGHGPIATDKIGLHSMRGEQMKRTVIDDYHPVFLSNLSDSMAALE